MTDYVNQTSEHFDDGEQEDSKGRAIIAGWTLVAGNLSAGWRETMVSLISARILGNVEQPLSMHI